VIGFTAILALKTVSKENVFTVEYDFFVGDPDKKGQSDNTRQGIASGDRADNPFRVVGDRHGFASKE